MRLVGFDFNAGRLDVSLHPFSGGTPAATHISCRHRKCSGGTTTAPPESLSAPAGDAAATPINPTPISTSSMNSSGRSIVQNQRASGLLSARPKEMGTPAIFTRKGLSPDPGKRRPGLHNR